MTEKFCLRWNDFEANISGALQELRDDKDFFDVTVACEDEQIQAHKVILSACSPFFRSVLKRNPHEHPLLYLKGIHYRELLAIVTFMYHGEVNVAQDELNTFLAAAEDLKVKGLTQHNNPSQSRRNSDAREKAAVPVTKEKDPRVGERLDLPKLQKKTRLPPPVVHVQRDQNEDEVQEVLQASVKSEPMGQAAEVGEFQEEEGAMVVAGYGDDYGEYGEEYNEQVYGGGGGVDPTTDNREVDEMVTQMMSKHENPATGLSEFSCTVCHKVMRTKRHMENHVETHIEGLSHLCDHCGKSFKTRNSRDKHKYTYHRDTGAEAWQ